MFNNFSPKIIEKHIGSLFDKSGKSQIDGSRSVYRGNFSSNNFWRNVHQFSAILEDILSLAFLWIAQVKSFPKNGCNKSLINIMVNLFLNRKSHTERFGCLGDGDLEWTGTYCYIYIWILKSCSRNGCRGGVQLSKNRSADGKVMKTVFEMVKENSLTIIWKRVKLLQVNISNVFAPFKDQVVSKRFNSIPTPH